MVYDLARLSFYKPPQRILKKIDCEKEPIVLAEELLLNNRTYNAPRTYRRVRGKTIEHVKRGYIDLIMRNFLKDNSNLIAFKVGRPSKLKRTIYSEEEFEEIEEENYPNVNVIWIKEQQLILIERNTDIFFNAESVINSLEDHLNSLLHEYELGISIGFLSSETTFWDYVNEYENRIYEVNFVLFAPNFFGNLQETTRDVLELTSGKYNADKLKVGISNEQGRLKVMSDDEQTSNCLSWIKEGGGGWNMKVIGDTGKKITIKSSDSARSLNITIDDYNVDSVINVIKSALSELNK